VIKNTAMTRSISKVARLLDINIETIRFYERRGLIKQPAKPVTGYRHYPDEIVNRIRFIRRTQKLGFTLNEINSLLALNDRPCTHVQELAEHKVALVKQKIQDLRDLETALELLLQQCHNNRDDNHWSIIDSLQGDGFVEKAEK